MSELDTVVIAIRLYKKDAELFKKKCRECGKFHSEVLRDLILNFTEPKKESKSPSKLDELDR